MDKAYVHATEAERAALTLLPEDLLPIQPQPAPQPPVEGGNQAGGGGQGNGGGAGQAAAVGLGGGGALAGIEPEPIRFLGEQTFADLEDGARCLGPLSVQLKAMDGYMRTLTRRAQGFQRTLSLLVEAGAKREGVAVAEIEPDEKATAVSRTCKELAVPSELRILSRSAGASYVSNSGRITPRALKQRCWRRVSGRL